MAVGPGLAAFPKGLNPGSKLVPSRDLLAGESGLFWSQEARMGLALHRAGKAEVGAMTSTRVVGTRAPGLAALDHAFRQRATAHGPWFSQFCGELAKFGGRRWIVHLYYGS